MQPNRPYVRSPDSASKDIGAKKWLFGVISAVTVSVFIVLAAPHIFHASTIWHFLLHLGSVTIAVFLSTVSFVSYRNTGNTRILLTALSFVALTIVELLFLLNTAELIGTPVIPVVDIDLSHVFLLGMLVLFGLGVLKVNK
jgi:hypothetical protein